MKFPVGAIFDLLYVIAVAWLTLKSASEAVYVIRRRTTDRKGKVLWFYAKVEGFPIGAKDRRQALVLTLGLTAAGLLLLMPFVLLVTRSAK